MDHSAILIELSSAVMLEVHDCTPYRPPNESLSFDRACRAYMKPLPPPLDCAKHQGPLVCFHTSNCLGSHEHRASADCQHSKAGSRWHSAMGTQTTAMHDASRDFKSFMDPLGCEEAHCSIWLFLDPCWKASNDDMKSLLALALFGAWRCPPGDDF